MAGKHTAGVSGPRVYPFARSVKKGDIMIDEELVRSMPRLGFGLMRLPRADVEKDQIDIPQTCRMVDAFLAAGGKYFDSAYVYNGSEEAAKAALTSRYPRDSYFITSKLNVNAKGITDESSAKAEFEESLRREGVDYIDFYLLHAVSSRSLPKFDKWHLWDFVRDLKAQGKIRHYGFCSTGIIRLVLAVGNPRREQYQPYAVFLRNIQGAVGSDMDFAKQVTTRDDLQLFLDFVIRGVVLDTACLVLHQFPQRWSDVEPIAVLPAGVEI